MSDDGFTFGPVDELCRKCSERVYCRTHPALRLCLRHSREHLASLPPFACTTDDIDAGESRCDSCGHEWAQHTRDGCQHITARLVLSYGEVVEDIGPHVCGCRTHPLETPSAPEAEAVRGASPLP